VTFGAILHAVDLWCPYLLGKCFQIKTDHQSLKYFLEQRPSSLEQQKWVTKLFGYDYEIIYKKGKDNVVVREPSSLCTSMLVALIVELFCHDPSKNVPFTQV
jgi:hypothetical protein